MPRRTPSTVYESCTTRSAPRSPDPSAGKTPCARAARPFGIVSRQVPGAVGSAVRTPTRTVTSDSRPTVATSGESDRTTVSDRRVRYSDATLAASTATSRMPKYISSTIPTSFAMTKQATASATAPVPRAVSGQRRLIGVSLARGDGNAHARGDAFQDRRDRVGGGAGTRAAG